MGGATRHVHPRPDGRPGRQTRIYREWNVPARGERELALLDLAADVLGGGKTSRLYQHAQVSKFQLLSHSFLLINTCS